MRTLRAAVFLLPWDARQQFATLSALRLCYDYEMFCYDSGAS